MLHLADLNDAPALSMAVAPTASERGDLRHFLRHGTAEAHRRLDTMLSAFDLSTRAGYRRFLEVNAAALLPLEDALVRSGVTRLFPDWPRRARRDVLMHDLQRLGGALRPLPDLRPFDAAGVLGTLYVLEGSRLGAKVVVRTVAASSDPVVAEATAYLRHGLGERLWPDFLAILEREGAAQARAPMLDAARRAFALFEQAAAS